MPQFHELPDAATLDGSEWLALEQGAVVKRRSAADFLAQLNGGTGLPPLSSFATSGYVIGSGDDGPALAAAMTAGGRVALPAGVTLNTGQPITAPAGAIIVGQGTTLQPLASMTSMVTMSGAGRLENVALVNVSGRATNAVQITKAADNTELLLSGVSALGFTRGFWSTSGDCVTLLRPRTQNCTTGIAIDNGMLNGQILYPYLLNGNGIDVAVPTIVEPEGLTIFGGCILPYLAGDFGVRLRSGLENAMVRVIVDQIAKSGACGLIIDSSGFGVIDTKVTDCWFGKNASATGTGDGIRVTGGATQGLGIRGNTFWGLDGWGVTVDGGLGIALGVRIRDNRFRSLGTGDVKLKATRAIVAGNDFSHVMNTVAADYTAYGVHSVTTENILVGAANPMIGNIAGSQMYGNIGNTNDQLLAPTMSVGAAIVLEPAGGASNSQLTVRAATGNAANLRLEGDGGLKFVRAHSNHLQVMSNDYSTVLFDIDDTGLITTPAVQVNGTDNMATNWTSQSGAVTSSAGSGLTATGTVRTKKIGRMVHVQAKVTISALGTGSGFVSITLPYSAGADACMAGVEAGVTGKALVGNMVSGGNAVGVRLYDGTYPIASTSSVLLIEGVYEASS